MEYGIHGIFSTDAASAGTKSRSSKISTASHLDSRPRRMESSSLARPIVSTLPADQTFPAGCAPVTCVTSIDPPNISQLSQLFGTFIYDWSNFSIEGHPNSL